jgi:hypothetical protein
MSRVRGLPSQEYLKECLRYQRTTGKLFWNERPMEHFKGPHSRNTFNSQNADKEAFTFVTDKGYKKGTLDGVSYPAHRIIFKMVHNEEPDEIDHQDGNKLNNAIHNLMGVDHRGNSKNRKLGSNNQSGYHGIRWNQEKRKWQATIYVMGVSTHLGFFDDKDEAIAARQRAEVEHGYHPNHGRSG